MAFSEDILAMKILVSGDVRGNFKQLFSRVSTIIKKNGQFDMLLCAGEFFSTTSDCKEHWERLIKGQEVAPIPTFILGPHSSDVAHFYATVKADGGELCENITCLGQRGVYTTSSGLVIAYLSGRNEYKEYKNTREGSEMTAYFTEQDVQDVERQCKSVDDFVGVDILLTPDWPKDICANAAPPIYDVERQCKSVDDFVGVDILLTPDWPKDICAIAAPPRQIVLVALS